MPTQQNIWDADWQPYDDEDDPFAGDWEATTPGTESPWQADWQPEVEEAPTFGGRVKESWETGKKQVSIGQMSFKQLMGDKTPETEERIQAIEETIPQGRRPSRALPEQAVRAAAEMAPIPLTGMEQGLKRGTALGLGFGAIATLGGPASPITVPAAAAAGFSIGMISASLENIGGIEAGLAYREFKDLKDPETGEKMSEGVAKVAGLTVGAINGAIELLQIKTFLRSIPGAEMLVRKGLTASVKKVLKSKSLKAIVFRAARKYGTGVATETGQEELQEIVNISGRYMATEVNNALKGTNIPTQTKKEIIDQLLETGKQSALAFSVFMAPGSAVSTTQDMAERRKVAGPGEADLLKTDKKAESQEAELREAFNTGKINSTDLKEIQSQLPKKHPSHKVIKDLLKQSEATTPEKDMMTGEVIALEPEDFLPAGAIPEPQMFEAAPQQEQLLTPQEAIPGAFQPLAEIPAEESAQVFEGAGLYQDKARADQIAADQRAEAEKVTRETYDRTTRPGYEGLTQQVKEKGEASEVEGMEFKVPYIRGLLEQVKGAEAGRRIRVTDYDGTEKWFGVPSEFPAFMKNRYSKKEVVSAIEKGLSGYVFPESEVRQASIWEDVKSEAYQMRNRDLRLAADTYLAEPTAIEGLDDKAYKLLITELRHEGYSTREIEEIAARHRKTIESDVIASIANEYGFSNEEIQEILDDPLEAVSDLESAWKEATATKPVAAYLTPITEAEVYESEKERRLARPEPRRKETPGRAVLERETGKQEAGPSGVFQEASPDEIEQKGQLIAKLINGNLFPGHKVKYDGIWPAMAPDMPDMFQFTAYAGPAKGATFISKELEADTVKEKLEDTVEKFSKAAPETEFKEAIDLAADEAETEPTEAQKEAGNYKKGHINLYGLDITIENPKGSIRKGVGRDGKPWETKLKHHYGYILRTEDKDGDQVDVFIGDAISSDKVFVVNQIDSGTKNFDEHKTMMGFETEQQARVAYLANYERGWRGLGNIVSLSVDEFKTWLKEADQTKPISKATIKGHKLPFMAEHRTKAELDRLYQGQVKTLTERVGPDKQKRAKRLAEVISAYKIELKKYPAEKAPIEKAPAPKALEQVLKSPRATEAEVTREKAHLKAMVIEGVKAGKYKGAVRFSTVIDLKKTVDADKLYVSREGAIHATPILGPDDDAFPAYGSYKNHAVAYIIPKKYITEKPDAHTKEVLIDPQTPLDAVTFLVDGQDKEFNIIELINALDARPKPEQLIKQYRDEYGDSEAMEFYQEVKGRQPRFSWLGAVVHRSTIDPDGWRITYFDAAGFSGHTEHKTIEGAVGDAIDAGITTPKPGLLDKTAEEPGFLEGTIKVYKAQKEHAAKMAAAKKLPEVEYHKAEDLAKQGYKSWDSRQGYDTDEDAGKYLSFMQGKYPAMNIKLVRYSDGTLSAWAPGKAEKELWQMTKAEQLEKVGRPVREHREAIVKAHKENKTIPTEVLEDFPEISKRLGFKKKEKAPVTEAKPKQKEWQALKVGDVFYDELNKQHLRVFGKGMTKKYEAQALADENDGMVWIDAKNKWAVVAKVEPLALTPEQGTPWERQAELEREGVVERPAKGKKVKAKFGEKGITGAGVVGRQTGLFGYTEGETTDMFAEAEEKAKKEEGQVPAKPIKAESGGAEEVQEGKKGEIAPIPAQILKNAGLVVTETLTKPKKKGKKPRPVWEVSGRIDPYVEIIRDLGGRKWGGKYSFWDDPTDELAEAVQEQGGMTFAEQMETKERRADEKADRLEERAGKARGKAAAARKAEEGISKHIPMGQPILMGHHSEKRARRDQNRIQKLTRDQITESDKANWLDDRVRLQRDVAKGEYTIRFMQNRVDEVEADIRGLERILSGEQYGSGPLRNEAYQARIARDLADAQEKLEYWKSGIEAAGGIAYSKENISKGDRVWIRGAWCIVERANPKTVSIIVAEGGAKGMKLKYKYPEIQKAETEKPIEEKPVEEKPAAEKVEKPAEKAAIPEPAPEKPAALDKKQKAKVASLRKAADNLQKQIDDKRNPAVASQNLTAKRARQAASMSADADWLERTQAVMRGLADDTENGTLPEMFMGIGTKAQIDQILTTKNFSLPGFHKSRMNDLVAAVKGVKGLASERMAIADMSRRVRHSEYQVDLRTKDEVKAVEAAIRQDPSNLSRIKDGILEGKRLLALNIRNQEEYDVFRDKLYDYVNPPSPVTQTQAKIREKEAALIGVKIPGFFPTPPSVGALMVEAADIQPDDYILEPSAGKGDLAVVIKEAHPTNPMQVAEIGYAMREILELKGFDIIGVDFLDMVLSKPGVQGLDIAYDKIIMNPPFENFQDIDHIYHAYELLAPGGRLVSLMSESAFFRSEKKADEFRKWLDKVGAEDHKLEDKSFTGKEAFRQTGVSARMVVIDKPGKAAPKMIQEPEPAAWGKGFPNVISHTNANKVETHPDHKAAKKGDMNAAIRLVDDLFKVDRAKALATRHPGAILVGVQSQEADGKNKLPFAFAQAISSVTGLAVDTEIFQTNVTAHTAKNALQRLLARAIFTGKVEKGRDYIILDDVITQGGTVSELKQYIESQGSNVVEVTSLACAQFANTLAVNEKTVNKLIDKYGRIELESILRENGIPPRLESLTQSEARQIALYKGPDSLRAAIAKERSEAGFGTGETVFSKEVREKVSRPYRPWAYPSAYDLKQAQKGLKILKNTLSKVIPADLMKSIQVNAAPIIEFDLTSPEAQRSLAEHGGLDTISGMTTINEFNALVEIAYKYDNDSMESTSYHEAFHVACKWLLPVQDYTNLMKYFAGNEEDAANAFSGFAMGLKGKELNTHPNFIKAIFLKLRRYFQMIRNGLQGKGFARPEDVFGKLVVGQYKVMVPESVIKSRLHPTDEQTYYSKIETPAEPMYSQLVNAVEKAKDMPKKVPSLTKWLKKWAKPEEIKWLDVELWLSANTKKDGTIDREEFLTHLRNHQISINEKVRYEKGSAYPDALLWSAPEALELDAVDLMLELGIPDLDAREWETYAVDGASQDVYTIVGSDDAGYNLFLQLDGSNEKEHLGYHDDTGALKEWAMENLDQRYTVPEARYEGHTLEGGADYKELLFTYPPRNVKNIFKVIRKEGKFQIQDTTDESIYPPMSGAGFFYDTFQEAQSKAINLNWDYHRYGIEQDRDFYRSPHWEETDVLAHARFKSRRDKDGRKVLFIEEIQSDWHQTAKKYGYQGDEAELGPVITIMPNTGQLGHPPEGQTPTKYWAMANGIILAGGRTEGEARARAQTILSETAENLSKRPPRAPFGKTWHEYVMKRLLRWAAENGFDTLAWTTGKQQIERYDLRQHIDLISWQAAGISLTPETTLRPKVNIRAFLKGEQKLHRKVGIMNELDSLLGQTMANQIRQALNRRETVGNIEAKDMVMGGQGMESFYDEKLPGFMRKYGKQWGATVGQTKVVTGRIQAVSGYSGPVLDRYYLEGVRESMATAQFPLSTRDYHALIQVIGAMERFGTDFRSAMLGNGTDGLAEYLGGKLIGSYSDITEDAHSIDITMDMLADVVFKGQTMFEGKKKGGGQAWAQQFIADALADAADNPTDKKAQGRAKRIRAEQTWFTKELPKQAYESTKAVIKAFKMGKKKGWSGMKPDTTFLERWLQTPEFYYKKVPAAWRVFMASLERQDNYNQAYSDLTNKDELLAEIQTFKKDDPHEYKRLEKLLIRADQIKATHGPSSLRELGFSDQAITAFLAFRQMMDNGFDALYDEMAKIIQEYEDAGLDLPEVATWVGDKEVVVNLKMALAQMGSMRGWYFPRQRKSGNWMLIAKKKGVNPVMEIFETATFANKRGNELAAQGYEVSKTATKELPEDVFQLAGKTVGLNAMINLALAKTIPEKMPTFEEYGLTPIMRTGPTGRKDFIVRGPTNKATNKIMKGLGGRMFSAAAGEPKAWHFFDAPSDMSFRVLRALITAKGIPGAAETDLLFAHALATEVANVVKGRGFRSAMVSRRPETGQDVWVGYDTDPLEVASRYVTGLAAGLAKKEAASKMVQAITGTDVKPEQFESFEDYLDEVEARRIDPGKQKNIFHDTTKYVQEMLRNQEFSDRVIGVIKGATVLKYLGFRLASPLVNLTALVTSVPATMHGLAKIPGKDTFGYLVKGIEAYHTYAFGNKEKLDPDIVEMFDHIQLKGWDNAQYNMEALAVLRSKLGNKWKWVMEKSMFMFGATEKLNRVATIMGTYMALKDQGKTNVSEMRDLAKSVSDRSHGTYGRTTYPYIALGKNPAAQAAQCLYVFSKFSHTYLQNMYDLGYKKHEWQSILWMAFAPAILAGAGSVPFIWPLLMSALRGILDVDEPEERFYSWFDDNFGEFIGNVARYGVAGFGGYGISLKGSLAIDPVESFPTRLPEIFGAPGNVVTDLWDGGKSLFKGDIFGAAQKMGPRVTGSMMQAYNEERYGVRTRTKTPKFMNGEKMEPENLDSILRFLNFNPAHMAKIKEQKWSQQRLVSKYRDLRAGLYSRVRAYYHKPQARRSRREYLGLLADIDEYNKRVQLRKLYEIKGISVITKQTIKTALKLKK